MKIVRSAKTFPGPGATVALAAVLLAVIVMAACGNVQTTTSSGQSVNTTASTSGPTISTTVAASTTTSAPTSSGTTSTTSANTTVTNRPPTSTTARSTTTTAAKPTTTTRAAATVHVTIQSFSFQPSSVTINAGDRVVWTNQDPTDHTVTADDGSFGSPGLPSGGTFAHKFTQAGTYAYHCSIHPSMNGVVTVQ